jgi:subtilisin family serine protease
MRETYAILWTPAELRQSAGSDDLVRRFGPQAAAEETGPRLAIESLDSKEASEIAGAPGVRAMAGDMATKLIEPCTSLVGDDGELPWGIKAVGAAASRFSGAAVCVAVLDTGIERAHPAFAGVNITEKDFSGVGNGDRNGHGTHCAGTIFGREVDGLRIGVAPGIGAALIGKVLGDDGGASRL